MHSFLAFCFPRHLYPHPSAIVDYKVLLANAVLAPANLVFASISIAVIATQVTLALGNVFGPPPMRLQCTGGVAVTYTVATMVVREFVLYADHVLVHRVPLLWEFHKVRL